MFPQTGEGWMLLPGPKFDGSPRVGENRGAVVPGRGFLPNVGLWRSWERASMAWKRSPVRSRPGPPILQSADRSVETHFARVASGIESLRRSTGNGRRLRTLHNQ